MSPITNEKLFSLTYNSTAIRPLTKTELEKILLLARNRNIEENLTGVLLFMDGKFTQYIEGLIDNLIKIFDLIKRASLHKEIINVDLRNIDERVYGDWSMAFFANKEDHLSLNNEEKSLREILSNQSALPPLSNFN